MCVQLFSSRYSIRSESVWILTRSASQTSSFSCFKTFTEWRTGKISVYPPNENRLIVSSASRMTFVRLLGWMYTEWEWSTLKRKTTHAAWVKNICMDINFVSGAILVLHAGAAGIQPSLISSMRKDDAQPLWKKQWGRCLVMCKQFYFSAAHTHTQTKQYTHVLYFPPPCCTLLALETHTVKVGRFSRWWRYWGVSRVAGGERSLQASVRVQ